jgi:hypothetical protein
MHCLEPHLKTIRPGCLDHRIVLRDLGHQYVVHTQARDGEGEDSFSTGDYFRKAGGSTGNVLSEAFSRFTVRSIELIDADLNDVIIRMPDRLVVECVRRRGLSARWNLEG